MLKFLVVVLIILAALTGIFFLIGAVAPENYSGEITVTANCPQEEVWQQLTNIKGLGEKRAEVDSVEVLEWKEDEPFRWKEYAGQGNYIVFEIVEKQRPEKLAVQIIESTVGINGKWSYQLSAAPEGTNILIREESTINDLFLRSLFTIMGRDATLMQEKQMVQQCRGR